LSIFFLLIDANYINILLVAITHIMTVIIQSFIMSNILTSLEMFQEFGLIFSLKVIIIA